jgi:phage N-6-adenine-methyltransferase
MTGKEIIKLAPVAADNDAKQIGEVFQRGKLSMVETMNIFVECGRTLIAKKREVDQHGAWLPWLRANERTLGFGSRTAQRLMAAARKCDATSYLGEVECREVSRQTWGNDEKRYYRYGGYAEWYTPEEYIDLARKVLGDIDLDPASCEIAQRTVKAKKFYTKEDNGLKKPWHGRVWLNPPYSNPEMGQFVDKLLAERNAKRVKAAILLSHNFTDTGWFQKAAMLCQAICFTRGRIAFVDADGQEQGRGNGQAFFYFGSNTGEFFDVFSEWVGVVVRP